MVTGNVFKKILFNCPSYYYYNLNLSVIFYYQNLLISLKYILLSSDFIFFFLGGFTMNECVI